MKQSKLDSALESITNVCVGFTINFTANMLIFPIFGWSISIEQNILLGALYTAISLVRAYAIRRAFDGKSIYQAIKTKVNK
mgnify:FL=1|tara:strand:- start:569 stop:811 length:243 start_codon:yes stop_codon:yes gene_type:complete